MLLQSAASLIPEEAIGVALKIIELCEVCKFLLRKSCKMVYIILLSEIPSSVERLKNCKIGCMPSDGGYRRHCYIEE